MNLMFDFYQKTNENFGPWAAFFLNRQCFQLMGQLWKERLLLFAAFEEGRDKPVAMSMIVRKDDKMLGRYWGSSSFVRNLHFELCYYAPIEYAIKEGVKSFDPGMGSEHKVRRGFGSHVFQSYHSFADADLTELFVNILPGVNKQEIQNANLLDKAVPWKKGQNN